MHGNKQSTRKTLIMYRTKDFVRIMQNRLLGIWSYTYIFVYCRQTIYTVPQQRNLYGCWKLSYFWPDVIVFNLRNARCLQMVLQNFK